MKHKAKALRSAMHDVMTTGSKPDPRYETRSKIQKLLDVVEDQKELDGIHDYVRKCASKSLQGKSEEE